MRIFHIINACMHWKGERRERSAYFVAYIKSRLTPGKNVKYRARRMNWVGSFPSWRLAFHCHFNANTCDNITFRMTRLLFSNWNEKVLCYLQSVLHLNIFFKKSLRQEKWKLNNFSCVHMKSRGKRFHRHSHLHTNIKFIEFYW